MFFKKYTFLAAAAALTLAAPGLWAQKRNAPLPAKGEVIFFDDFSDKKLNRANWNAVVTGFHVNDELQAYVDSPAVISIVHGAAAQGASNGALQLIPRYSPKFKTFDGKQFDFISGRINSQDKFDFTYGTAEARIKMSAGDGLWPAWWALGYGNWPACGEIDIMEFVGEADWASAAVHGPGYSGETPFVDRLYFDKGNDVTQWHIYAVDWTPDAMIFKYDGKVMFRVTRAMAEHYGKWAFDNKKYLILNYALGGAYPVKINGVKQPYYGLPQSSVEMIKKGDAWMLVDWVKVTKTK
ncbi:glycoside hydrolase family 16 protein [Mucilaginibacter lacusdianchii]|uniref:glycoside hydrolase family 16 protein n=1 Tax=Mucilaginibacter lacusdianchii TaxID=2684211 RepID=UPI00131CC560|nr:glycoside hydrolase family 16 protein [Mucilaginibacter sp. JXJ CY 39]